MATAIVVGTVIGSGVFKKPQVVAANVPTFGIAAMVWVLVGLLAFLGALSLAEVAVLFPRAGGNYVFLREAYGRLAGFLWGWVEFWIIRSASLAALATIFTESLHDVLRETVGVSAEASVLGYWEQRLLTVAVLICLAWVNIRGVRWGGGLQLFITTIKVSSLLAIAVLPFVIRALGRAPIEPFPATSLGFLALSLDAGFPAGLPWGALAVTHLQTVPVPLSLGRLGTAFLAVLWAYHGWMNIAPVAEEVRRPQRNIPLGLLGGTLIVIALYLGANFAYYQVLSGKEMAAVKDTPVATAFSLRLLGPVGAVVTSAAIMCSVFGALNGNLLVGPRLLYAMGEDSLAPRALSRVHPRYHTPALAIGVMAAWACLLILAVALLTQVNLLEEGKAHFDILTDFAMFGAVIFETLAVATIFVFRRRLPDAPRPYRCFGYPVVPLLYLIIPAFILGNMFMNQRTEALVGVCFIALGAGVYYRIDRGPMVAPTD
jgi:amino acid transporter